MVFYNYFRKKFGFTSLVFNLLLYLCYLLPLTALALYSRDNEKKFCASNYADTRKVGLLRIRYEKVIAVVLQSALPS